jgi:hypothetical protein
VKLRLLDGSIRGYPMEELARIEYADGTVSTSPQPVPARYAEAAPAPRAKPAEGASDTVYFLAGGRVRGTVIEEHPKTGVKVRLLDGTIQTYSRDDLVRVEYADGSVSRRVTPAPAAPALPPAVAPQPAAAPPFRVEETPQIFPIYLSLGVGATFLGGDAARSVPMSEVVQTEQAHLAGELGLRLSHSLALGVYGDVGGGDPGKAVRAECQAQGIDCAGVTGRVGVLVRHTWQPLSKRPVWLSLGTGWEFGGVSVDQHHDKNDSNRTDLFSYSGREYLRLGGGVDFRSNSVFGFGLYGSVAVGEYDRYKDPTTTIAIERSNHTTGQVGLRFILFP